MTATRPIEALFDGLQDAGETLDLWWRDDDAIADTPALRRLLRSARLQDCPLALAAIPAAVTPSLVRYLAGEASVDILVHGFAHANRAEPGAKPAEFGADRPCAVLAREAQAGLAILTDAFADRTVAIFVPPWNRISPEAAAALPALGYAGLSAFGPDGSSIAGLRRLDTHLDPVDWRGTRSLVAPDRLAQTLQTTLARGIRTVGFLTHHLVFDEALWAFTDELLSLAAHHPAVRLRSVADLLAVDQGRPAGPPLHAPRRILECTP